MLLFINEMIYICLMPTIEGNSRKRPWHKKASKDTSAGYNGNNKEFYNSSSWRSYSRRFRAMNRRCAYCGKIQHDIKELATDHIIPISKGGSKWDRRNHQPLCKNPCHAIKSGKESNGHTIPFILNNNNERIPDQSNP